jgi:hypothetical protein
MPAVRNLSHQRLILPAWMVLCRFDSIRIRILRGCPNKRAQCPKKRAQGPKKRAQCPKKRAQCPKKRAQELDCEPGRLLLFIQSISPTTSGLPRKGRKAVAMHGLYKSDSSAYRGQPRSHLLFPLLTAMATPDGFDFPSSFDSTIDFDVDTNFDFDFDLGGFDLLASLTDTADQDYDQASHSPSMTIDLPAINNAGLFQLPSWNGPAPQAIEATANALSQETECPSFVYENSLQPLPAFEGLETNAAAWVGATFSIRELSSPLQNS